MKNNSAKKTGWFKRTKKQKDWEDMWADYPGVGKVYYADVGRYAMKHLRIRDRFNPAKIGCAVALSESIAFGCFKPNELPKKKNWKFFRDF